MLLLLVRHGLTDATATRLAGRLPAIGLNDAGRAQAHAVADRLAGLSVGALYSSPLQRCLETAVPLAERLALEPIQDPGLLEVDYGDWAGQEFKALRKSELWRLVQERPSAVWFPGGESLRGAQERVIASLEAMMGRHPKGVVAAFTHADPIRLAVAHFTGVHLDLYQRLAVSPGSTTVIQFGPGHPVLLRLSDTASLDELRPRRPRRGQN